MARAIRSWGAIGPLWAVASACVWTSAGCGKPAPPPPPRPTVSVVGVLVERAPLFVQVRVTYRGQVIKTFEEVSGPVGPDDRGVHVQLPEPVTTDLPHERPGRDVRVELLTPDGPVPFEDMKLTRVGGNSGHWLRYEWPSFGIASRVVFVDNRGGGEATLTVGQVTRVVPKDKAVKWVIPSPKAAPSGAVVLDGAPVGSVWAEPLAEPFYFLLDPSGRRTYTLKEVSYSKPGQSPQRNDRSWSYAGKRFYRLDRSVTYFLEPSPDTLKVEVGDRRELTMPRTEVVTTLFDRKP